MIKLIEKGVKVKKKIIEKAQLTTEDQLARVNLMRKLTYRNKNIQGAQLLGKNLKKYPEVDWNTI